MPAAANPCAGTKADAHVVAVNMDDSHIILCFNLPQVFQAVRKSKFACQYVMEPLRHGILRHKGSFLQFCHNPGIHKFLFPGKLIPVPDIRCAAAYLAWHGQPGIRYLGNRRIAVLIFFQLFIKLIQAGLEFFLALPQTKGSGSQPDCSASNV